MSQKVADSLVTISQIPCPSEIHGGERLDRAQIKAFWQAIMKAFFTSRQASDREMDHRLEYLFWRIWSSKDLLDHINMKYMDWLVSRIMASEPLVPSAWAAHEQTSLSLPISSTATSLHGVPQPESRSMPQGEVPRPQGEAPESATLHPILKKSNTSHDEPPKKTRLVIEQPGIGSITRSPSNPPTPSVVEPKDIMLDQPVPKRTSLAAPSRTSRGGKRRPLVVGRRKSSQAAIPRPSLTNKKQNAGTKASGAMEEMFDADDDMISEPSTPKSTERKTRDATWADLDHDQPFIDYPVTLTPAAASILTDGKHPASTPTITITPAGVLPMSNSSDSMKPQRIQTVSDEAQFNQQTKDSQTEPQDISSSEDRFDFHDKISVQGTLVPGFKDAYRIPMPEKMMDELLAIIRDDTPLDGPIRTPDRPLHLFDHAWHPLPQPNYLFDFMIEGSHAAKPRPPQTPLVSKNFRKEWNDIVAEENRAIAERKTMTAEAQESLSFIQQGREYRETGEDCDDSQISLKLQSLDLQSQDIGEQLGHYSDSDDSQILRELQTELPSR
ncbi:hypothetical protein N7504_002243 [Penicillium tannophilum]|nr:hypothetical protein N7504_002243 [Penicillium tannophilum]